MKTADINIMVGSLKAQISVLEAKIKQLQKIKKTKKFADFYGIFKEAGETTEEEIKAAEYKLKEDLL